jgi:hypothetical protein
MSVGRYYFVPTYEGKFYATTSMSSRIFTAADRGAIPCALKILDSTTRLDILAFDAYGDASLWWIIAAASGIGWSLQLSPGTYIRVPTDLNAVYEVMRNG